VEAEIFEARHRRIEESLRVEAERRRQEEEAARVLVEEQRRALEEQQRRQQLETADLEEAMLQVALEESSRSSRSSSQSPTSSASAATSSTDSLPSALPAAPVAAPVAASSAAPVAIPTVPAAQIFSPVPTTTATAVSWNQFNNQELTYKWVHDILDKGYRPSDAEMEWRKDNGNLVYLPSIGDGACGFHAIAQSLDITKNALRASLQAYNSLMRAWMTSRPD
jgi:hypothetical protein